MVKIPYYSAERGKTINSGAYPKYDWDSDEFYAAIETLASNGATDKEIGPGLVPIIGVGITPNVFSKMKNGLMDGWSEEENIRRSEKIKETLGRARLNTNRLVKAVYLSTALGKKSTKTVTTIKRRMRIDGVLTDNEDIQTTEVVSGIAPNLQALANWLYMHDEEWRRISKGEDLNSVDPNQPPRAEEVKRGVDISQWLNKELLDKEDEKEENDTHA